MAGSVAASMYLLGGMHIHGLATAGSALALSALAWLGANICVGVAEEFWFRSYFLQALWKSLGFWPASIVIALIFAADHYFFKTGENVWDVITLVSLSLMMCYSVLRTGTLWFAVGFHIAFDYMQLFVIGTPNGARVPQGRLLDTSFDGPAWLSGGELLPVPVGWGSGPLCLVALPRQTARSARVAKIKRFTCPTPSTPSSSA